MTGPVLKSGQLFLMHATHLEPNLCSKPERGDIFSLQNNVF